MTLPSAPVEGGGDKLIPLIEDQGSGTLVVAAFRAIARGVSSNSSDALAHLGVASHKDAQAWVASDPVMVVAGHNGGSPGTVRKLQVDDAGRQVIRPPLLYTGPSYAEIRSVGNAAISGIQTAWMGVATHVDGATFVQATDGVLVLAGVVQSGNAVKDLAADTSGRLSQYDGLVWAPTNTLHVDVAAGPNRAALKGSSTPARRVRIKADAANANTIYVGGSTVTADENVTTGGFPLSAGQEVTLDLGVAGDLNVVYIHGTAGQGAHAIWWT